MENITSIISTATGAPVSSPAAPPPRKLTIAAAQMGPVHLSALRSDTLSRMLSLMATAHGKGARIIVYPELAFTTFFPRHYVSNLEELELFFERYSLSSDETQSPGMKPIFDKAREYGMDVSVGFAECDTQTQNPEHVHYNTAVYYSASADQIISKYRKVHLPGTAEPYADPTTTNQLEKRYFRPGDLGFQAFRAPGLVQGAATKSTAAAGSDTTGLGDPIIGTLICNDRRWAEAWREYGLQGAELILCGFNTTAFAPELVGTHPKLSSRAAAKAEALFHHKLSIQSGSYTNACWSVNVAKCGVEDGVFPLIGGTCFVDPDGAIVIEAETDDSDEVVVCEVDLGLCRRGKGKVFAFERHRRVEHYGRIGRQTGVREVDLL